MITCTTIGPKLIAKSKALSYIYSHLDIIQNYAKGHDLSLIYDDKLCLIDNNSSQSFYISFFEGKDFYRVVNLSKHKEPLLKAIAYKGQINNLQVADATAGLGRDSLLMQSAGACVHMYERNILVYALLEDALARASIDENRHKLKHGLPQLMPLGSVNSHNIMYDVIYYDPMFPPRQKSAKVKKNMQFFHQIVGFDEDIEENIYLYLQQARYKLVLKRPKDAPILEHKVTVAYSVDGGACRFDCYVK